MGGTSTPVSRITVAEFNAIAADSLPFFGVAGLKVESISAEQAVLRAVHQTAFLRPGGTIAGPVMMGLADAAFYAVIMGNLGAVELAVTTQLSINFLRKPPPGDIIATARPLKLGKRLAVCEAGLFSEALGPDLMVAHATATYSIPPGDPIP